MSASNSVTQSLLNAANATSDATEKASLIGAIKDLAEAEKLNAEAGKLREETSSVQRLAHQDARRFTITVLAPSISALAVVLALGVQVYQINKNSTLQREMNEGSSLRETLKLAGSTKATEALTGTLFLTSMLNSPSYGATARSISLNLLVHIADPTSFEALFSALAASTTLENFSDLSRLSRRLTDGLSDSRRKIADQEAEKPTTPSQGKISPKLLEASLNEEVRMVADSIIAFIRRTPRNGTQMLDLRGANLSTQDLRNLNLSNTDISGATFADSTVVGIDLSNVKTFDDSTWSGVEWWRAKNIGSELLEYLKKEYPFNSSSQYTTPQGFQPSNPEDFARDLQRLSKPGQ
jgi:hypothetical protein